MSDIDFDELDQAVNNLMANVDTTKRNESADDPEDKAVTLDVATPQEQIVQEQSPSQPASESEAVTTSASNPVSAAPALAVKRRGQFMDVMHPSSDMKAAKPVKHEGVRLAPATDINKVASTSGAGMPVPAEELSLQAAVAPEATVDNVTEQSPLLSPFLPDAKPEKRPLGNGVSDTTSTPSIDIATELHSELSAEEQRALPPDPSVLPPELQTDVLAVESADNTAVEPAMAPGQPEEVPVLTEEYSGLPSNEPTSIPAGGSITQQYTESPSSGDQTNGSIYDTSNYHQPIEAAPAAKKFSPLKWVLLAIGLLVLGGGGGVTYFLLMH